MSRYPYNLGKEWIFGDKIHYYTEEIDNALHCRGKYRDAYEGIHAEIVLHINSRCPLAISKVAIYVVLEALIEEKDEVYYSGAYLPPPAREILILAKEYIDKK